MKILLMAHNTKKNFCNKENDKTSLPIQNMLHMKRAGWRDLRTCMLLQYFTRAKNGNHQRVHYREEIKKTWHIHTLHFKKE